MSKKQACLCGCRQRVRNRGYFISGHNHFNRNQNKPQRDSKPRTTGERTLLKIIQDDFQMFTFKGD
jgi:hypothetical protein